MAVSDDVKLYILCILQRLEGASDPRLTDLGRMSPPGHVLGPDGLLDAIHLLLVALAVARCVLLGLLQSRLKGLDPLSRSTKTFLQFRKLTAQVCVITYQLWGNVHRVKSKIVMERRRRSNELK